VTNNLFTFIEFQLLAFCLNFKSFHFPSMSKGMTHKDFYLFKRVKIFFVYLIVVITKYFEQKNYTYQNEELDSL
jgi:hypothetical protein